MAGDRGTGRRKRHCGNAAGCAPPHRTEQPAPGRGNGSSSSSSSSSGRRGSSGISGGVTSSRGRAAAAAFVRAVAVLVALLLLGVASLGDVAEAAITFVPTNVAQLSLYQTAQMRFDSNPFIGDPRIRDGDTVYFVKDVAGVSCSDSGSGDPDNTFAVTPLNGLGLIGYATIVVRSSVFSLDASYLICYIAQGTAFLIARAKDSGPPALLVWPAVYNRLEMQPPTASGGLGLVSLAVSEAAQAGRPVNQGLTGANTIFLLPCPAAGGGGDCGGLDKLPQLCAGNPYGGVQLSDLRGAGTTSVTGSFTVPYVPDRNGYAVCVPYCFDAAVGCGVSVAMSYTAVTVPPLTFAAANPLTYELTPAAPQAREKGYMLLRGTELTAKDELTVIRGGSTCASKASPLLENLELGSLAAVSAEVVNITFVAPELIPRAMRGTVCYRRAGNALWSTVLRDPRAEVDDFVIEVLQPTGFTVAPESPYTGEPLSLFFRGTGLDAARDAAILTTSLDCDAAAAATTTFECPLTGGSAPQCTALIDPPTDLGLTLHVCYRKEGVANYARVRGHVVTQNRNPTYNLSPYPLYAGQRGTLTFLGHGLSLADSVRFIASSATCGDGSPVSTFAIANGVEVAAGEVYKYDVVGTGKQCLQVCYRISGSVTWSVARPQVMTPVSDACPAQDLYVSVYGLRYAVPNTPVTAKETVTLTLSLILPSTLKLVRMDDACAVAFCTHAGALTTACEVRQDTDDFVSELSGKKANLLAGAANTSYILCAASGGDPYIPVLPNGQQEESTSFAFVTAAANPVLGSHAPQQWRVAFASLRTTFDGASLDSDTDAVRALLGGSLLSATARVCPSAGAVVQTALVAQVLPGAGTTSTTAAYSLSHLRHTGDEVHFCYLWDAGRRVTYAGSLVFAARLPSEMTSSPPPPGGFRAGAPVSLNFTSNTTALQAQSDILFFYRFDAVSHLGTGCYCGLECPAKARVTYPAVPLVPGATTAAVSWTNPQGFDNYDSDSVYVVCYNVTGAQSATYMGQLSVGMAQPTYYTAQTAGDTNRVGSPITLTATQLCVGASCRTLSTKDDMRLIPATKTCLDLVTGTEFGDVVEPIGNATVTGTSYVQRVVVNLAGDYRVCYRLDAAYEELTSDVQRPPTPLRVDAADPVSFAATPAAPSAGQLISVQLSCSDGRCSVCRTLRLVPGNMASCWVAVSGTLASDTCLTTKVLGFPSQYPPQGTFTACYGAAMTNSRRVPGALEVAAANPATFTASNVDIFVNQDSAVTLTLVGTGLTSQDQIFLLTTKGYSCHDLATNVLQSNGTLRLWFAPSIHPNPITVDAAGTGATWVVSDRTHRFGEGLLFDPSFCDNPGVSCSMRLCYMRSGTSWAPVPIEAEPDLRLLPPNPLNASFDSYPLAVGMYSAVTVFGQGLTAADTVVVRRNTCGGVAVTVPVGTATVSADGTQWVGVVRFTAAGAVNYAVCYTFAAASTEIGVVRAGRRSVLVVLEELYYLYDAANLTAGHVLSRYEALMLGASFAKAPEDSLAAAAVIAADTECNYMPYYEKTGLDQEFAVLLELQRLAPPYFGARFTLPADTYALCLQVDLGLFRVTRSVGGASMTTTAANPSGYTAWPELPFPDQPFTLTFPLLDGSVGAADTVAVIDGGLYDCGYRNTTIAAEYPVAPDPSAGAHVGVVAEATLPAQMLGKALTVCYRRSGGTFATVPRDTLVDRNFRLSPQIPSEWTWAPVQPQAERTLLITFLGDEAQPDFLQTTDRAALVAVPAGGQEPTCEAAAALVSGELDKAGASTTWTIAASLTQEGTYIVCYTSTRNGAPVRVDRPPLLTIYPLQSPKGIFKGTGGPVNVFSGERFYLMFDTSVPLDPVLSYDSAASEKDAVLFSTERDCSAPLPASQVATIPAAFQYKPVVVKNPSGIVAPYLNLVLATGAKELVVCMRRTGRHEGEAFYNYEMIGDLTAPATVRVSEAPITTYATDPQHPRAWVPSTVVTPTYGGDYVVGDFSQLFFANSTAAGGVVDDCYRPTAQEAAGTPAEGVVLLDTTLQVEPSTGLMLLPFPRAGPFQLCLQLHGATQHAASVHAAALQVLNPSPTMYVVPEIIAVGAPFQMAFRALDDIFAPTVTGNVAEVFVAPAEVVDGEAAPDCAAGVPPAGGGATRFDSFTAESDTYATVQPRIEEKGYFYVCFRVYDATASFAVPNAAGGFVFSVGLTGAQSYAVAPSPAYMGELLNITILGNVLSSADHVKLVAVTGDTPSANYSASCTAAAPDADAEEIHGAAGSEVDAVSPTQAQYTPRVNATGDFILCYQSAALADAWVWVSQLHSFSVGPPHPDAYVLQPLPFYAAEVGQLRIRDSPNTALLTDADEIRLVQRGSGVAGFDCSAAAAASPDIGLLERVAAMSNDTDATYQLCALTTTQVTVCYRLKRGAWAEVPRRVPPPSYLFEPAVFVASPFAGPTVTPSAPRPYEPFVLAFTSSAADVAVNYVGFAPAPQQLCTPNPPYVQPVYYVKNTTVANTFTVALPAAGEYQLYLGPHAAEGDPRIAHGRTLTVAPCDPCSFAPSYSFIENHVALRFTSSGGPSLGLQDTVRLVPVSQGSSGNPCAAPSGAFASLTLEANATVSTSAATVFNLFTGDTDASCGDYYLCYRKGAAGDANYALLTDTAGQLLNFSIYPALPTQAVACESHPAFLETVTLNFSFPAAAYPKLAFSAQDEFLLLPPNVSCGAAAAATAPGVLHPVLLTLVGRGLAVWLAHLPGGRAATRYEICFRLAADAVARVVAPSTLDVAPQDPAQVATEPWLIQPETAQFTMQIYGDRLSAKDDVYVVDASQRCDERCGETLAPPQLASAVYTKTLRNATLMELEFTQPLNEEVVMALCYRRAGRLLVRLAVFFVGNTNPEKYDTDFVPRLGTRPTLTFHGVELTPQDRVFILPEGMNCEASYATALGSLRDVAAEGTRSRFYVPLAAPVAVGPYAVCYLVNGSVGYALMPAALEVQAGGASQYRTSNTPMRARATVVTFDYAGGVGDTAMIACAGCSCWDGAAAVLPYGTPEGNATETQREIALRVGFDDTAAYAVCYRVSDSGYAQVGALPLRPAENAPDADAVAPTPTYQGQRLLLTVTGFERSPANSSSTGEDAREKEEEKQRQQQVSSDVLLLSLHRAPTTEDAAMLVTVDRRCWDTPALQAAGILAGPSLVAEVTANESVWRGHVPSLGPGALPLSSFPTSFTLCYREGGQDEFVTVPFPSDPSLMLPADPSSFATVPASVSSGMLHVGMTFPGAADGDTAFIVKYAGDVLETNHACDDATSVVLTTAGPTQPSYIFSLPPLLTASSVVVCYVRAGATVAEVPRLLPLVAPNPGGYVINTSTAEARQRQYLRLTLTGAGLDPATDAVVFTDASCASSGTWPPVSAAAVRRASALAAAPGSKQGTALTLVAQFIETVPAKLFVCYRRGEVWSEVGTPFALVSPVPDNLTLSPPVGLARVGQHVQIELHGADGKGTLAAAAVISALDSSPESWCQNFTAAKVQEPLLRVVNDSLLEVAVWRTAGPARVCVRYGDAPWSDVALTATGAVQEVVVGGPNPSSMRPFPNPPRVGQQVTLTFQLEEAPSAGDRVRVTLPEADVACEQLQPAPGFPKAVPVVPDAEAKTANVTLIDDTDPFAYRSFSQAGQFQICYYSAAAQAWSPVGGSMETSVLQVLPLAPGSWSSATGASPVFAEPFVLHFEDASGSLDASGDAAWAAPPSQSCGVPPADCTECIVFEFNAAASTAARVTTKPAVSLILGEFNVCYRLADATAALLLPALEVVAGDIRCVEQASVRVGQEQNITFEKKPGVEVAHDSWRVSFFGTSATSCGSGYDPDFVEGRARLVGSTDTSVTYGVEWPVAMVSERYLICYTHDGVARSVCTCAQLQARSGECYISTLEASPRWFVPSPDPTYVGQTVQLRLTLDPAMAKYPVTDVRLVTYVDPLTVCDDPAAFPLRGTMTAASATLYVFEFNYPYTQAPGTFIVCALSPTLSAYYARVGTVLPATSSNTFSVRPYMALTTLPSAPDLIRAMQTLRLTFTHISSAADDVVGAGDRVTFVASPEDCVEAVIDHTPAATVMRLFVADDTSFATVPAPVLAPSNVTRSSLVDVTFDPVRGLGEHVVCYKLSRGTWAPVRGTLHVLAAAVEKCELPPSTSSPGSSGGASGRAMQYLRTIIVSTEETSGLRGPEDAVRVVPQSSPCIDDASAVFLSGVSIVDKEKTAVIAFAPSAGEFKICYRIGGAHSTTANWSPVCTGLELTAPTPTGAFTGCLRLGQCLTVTASQRSGFGFTLTDTFRFVTGADQCIYANDTQTVSDAITVGDAAQTLAGTPVTSIGPTFVLPAALLGAGSTTFRLCYKDAVGNQFAVPLDAEDPDRSEFAVAPRLLASVQTPGSNTAGQRVLMLFTAAQTSPGGALTPFSALPPIPFSPGPVYDGSFDAATALHLSPALAYRDGRCFVADPTTYGVYGNRTQVLGSFDPVQGGAYVACYRAVGCSVEDVGPLMQVGGPNPASFAVSPSTPRRGQLLRVAFVRNREDPDALPLSPGEDRAAAQVNLPSCWTLPADAGQRVDGTADTTDITGVLFAAQPPYASSVSQMRLCYELQHGSWSNLPAGVVLLQPANPISFTVQDAPARVMQLNYIEFTGKSLGAMDRVKVIATSSSCPDASVPPKGIVSHAFGTGAAIPGTADGWTVTNATARSAMINISSTETGTFSVCYRLAADTVWTRVYGDLVIDARDPAEVVQTPAHALEGELFTLNFTAAGEAAALSASDQVALYTGDVPCLAPGKAPDVIITSPSRTDLLPRNLFFQIAAETRGDHTLCYWKSDGRSIVWGFGTVVIGPNPLNYTTVPAAAALRSNQLVSAVFWGFGLIADTQGGKTDRVKLIPSEAAQTDGACQTVASAAGIEYYPLVANGTLSVQVFRSPPRAASDYWVCYKLDGGQFHVMPGAALALGAADPYAATASKSGDVLWDGEMDTWTIRSTQPPVAGALAFYSVEQCNDFPYYVHPTPSPAQFPNGVAVVRDGVAQLRTGPAGDGGVTVALCYYAAGAITMLSGSAVRVVQGVPPPLAAPVPATALQAFQFNLTVVPTPLDYVVLVAHPEACVGLTAPAVTSDVFVDVLDAGGHVVVTSAVETAGTFYICYSHRIGRCGAGATEECARVVGTVEAAAANPSNWTITPATVFTSDEVEITLLRPADAAARALETLWLTPIHPEAAATMKQVAAACIRTMTGGDRIELRPKPHQSDVWTARLDVVAAYALCYISKDAALPTIFPPLSHAGPVVQLTNVSSVFFAATPVVGINATVVLQGRGLSQDDQLVAVGLPAGREPPADICSNLSYTPRVTAVPSTAGYGFSAIVYQLLFATPSTYTLCFHATASTGPMLPITTNHFNVNPAVLSYTVMSVALNNTPLELEFQGKGLQASDQAALLQLPSVTGVGGASCALGDYTAVSKVSADGTTSLYITVPTQPGNYAVCYRKPSFTPILLPSPVSVSERTATGATFTVRPGCAALETCSPQPVVALTNAAGEPTSDPGATVAMHLRLADGKAADELLTGGTVYTQKNYSVFYFFVVAVSTAGEYTMEAEFTLRGGVRLRASLPNLVVGKAGERQGLAAVSCDPVGIIERPLLDLGESKPAANITCVIAARSPLAPTAYTVQLNAGRSTDVVIDAHSSSGLPRYNFTVFPPYDQPMIQFVSIITRAAPPLESWPVTNSPVIVRIGSEPEEGSTLSCASDSADLPSSTMVRFNSSVTCHAQGRRRIGDVEVNIVALPKYMKISREYNDDQRTDKAVDIGAYPENLDGDYEFHVEVAEVSQSMSVLGFVPTAQGSGVYTPMQGSPSRFTVIGEPQPGESSLACESAATGSELWFTPVGPFQCTLSLRAGGMAVNGVSQDFLVTMPQGGSTQPIPSDTWGPTLAIAGAAPPMAQNATTPAAASQLFSVVVAFTPLSQIIATATGTLVYATSIDAKKGGGGSVALMLTGSGLSPRNRYGVRATVECDKGVDAEASVTGSGAANTQLQLVAKAPADVFYLCFAPSDQHTRWQLLSNVVLNHHAGGGVGMWTTLLIVGVVLLFLLLVLLVVVIWRVCMLKRREEPQDNLKAVYLPPRANYRFLRRDTRRTQQPLLPAPSPPSSLPTPTQPPDGAAAAPKTRGNKTQLRINVNDRDVYSADVALDRNGNTMARHVGPAELQKPERRGKRGPEPRPPVVDTDSSEDDMARFIPPVPPPLPPRDDDPAPLIGAVVEPTEAHVRAAEEEPRSGPYQHLHHPRQEQPPMEAPPPAAVAAAPTTATAPAADEGGGENAQWVGPFLVRGHTSRPMVSQPPAANGHSRNGEV
ncbi:hemagluttinin family protein [Trypanosoma conorhini]|uniref:Hemagluttinin family protein n=1 Tax=Trypanosoma conorhini TaxID=83891 RepID=A0A3R7LN17_9TRYP|nr:hemagluttinin family protein [Trypanosoma conorhini]RNF17634.1 hemagluttinin family protein [Trypanosoma conorhini]